MSFGLELFELLEGALAGTAGAVEAPLELAEGLGLMAGGLTEGIFVIGLEGVVVVVCPKLGFGGAEAALEPLAVDEVVDEGAGFGGGGAVALVVLGDEEFEIGEFLGREDEGFGVDAGFEGVHGGSGLACDRGGAGGFLGIAAVGFYLTESRHGGSGGAGGPKGYPGLSYFDDRGAVWGIRGWMAASGWKQGAKILNVCKTVARRKLQSTLWELAALRKPTYACRVSVSRLTYAQYVRTLKV